MRTAFLTSLALLATTGCTPGDLAFEHTADLSVDARGIAYTDDDSAQTGMSGVTCAIDPETGNIEEDVDVVDEDDQVVDAHDGEALVANSMGVAFYVPGMGNDSWEPDVLAPSLQDAGFTAGGTATLDAFQGCNLTFHTANASDVRISDDACVGAEVATSGNLDVVAVAANAEGFLVSQSGDRHNLGAASHVALDELENAAYTASGSTLSAFSLDGTERWSVELSGDVVDLDVLAGNAAVMVAHGNGSGELMTFSGATGELSSSLPTPTPSESIATSDSGREIAMILPFEVHFFDVKALD
ncbi:MAG: hypothetical protein KC912_01785 [Proteobacteria bacterium]|nr:hypothetical protein [Pseudomonadota bacterium]